MGRKVNPRSFRQTTTYHVPSRWFARKQDFAQNLKTDVQVRKMIRAKFREAGIARVEIERSLGEITLIIYTSKPGMVIGTGGSQIEQVKKEVKREFFGSQKMKVTINIQEIGEPEMNSELIFQSIRDQLEQRVPFRRAIKRAMEQVIRAGAKGCRIQVSGRLNGAEIARREFVAQGRLPLQTLRAQIDYSRGIAQTIYGVIGIKVWIYKGELFGDRGESEEQEKVVEDKKEKPHRDRPRRKQIQTGGKKLILRKKADVEKEKEEQITPANPS